MTDSDPDKALGGTFEKPKPGVYKAKVTEINDTFAKGDDGKPDKNRPMLEVVYEITKGKNKGAKLWDYVSFSDAAKWKLDQFLQAMGVATKKKRKGSFDTAELIGMPVNIRVKGDTYNHEYTAKIGAVMQGSDEDLDDDEEDEDDETEDEEDELEDDEEDSDEDEDEDEDDEADEDEDSDEEDEEDEPPYDEWDLDELKEECKNRELSTKGTKKALVKRLEEDDNTDAFDDE